MAIAERIDQVLMDVSAPVYEASPFTCIAVMRNFRAAQRHPADVCLGRESLRCFDLAPRSHPTHSIIQSFNQRAPMKQYKVVIYQEGMLGSLLLGASKVDPVRFTDFLNKNAAQGWRVVTMEKDIRRMLLLWRREGYVVVMERDA